MESSDKARQFLPRKLWLLKSIILVVILALVVSPVLAAQANPRVAPPNSMPYGKSYSQWGGEWWKYMFSFPADTNPVSDPTGANCALDQSGPVFFLAGTISSSIVRDECAVPAGKALFFPIVNFVGAVPEDGATPQEVQDLVTFVTNYFDELWVSVDGAPLQNLWSYRASQFFPFTGAIDNPFDTSCGTPGTCYEGYHESGFTDGYWIFLFPLPPGAHTINFGGHFNLPDWGWEFTVDVTYHLTVAAPGIR